MQPNEWSLALAMSLIFALSAKGEITKGVMSVTGAEMD
jgi:hypothetical protein